MKPRNPTPRKLIVEALAGNQNAAKFDEPTARISARIPVSLHAWLSKQKNQSTTITTALEQIKSRKT
jgi:ABC-type sugar transport system ATPase subunit